MTEAPKIFDRSHDYLGSHSSPLEAFFRPKTVAVIGASDKPGSVGQTIVANLLKTNFGGTVSVLHANLN